MDSNGKHQELTSLDRRSGSTIWIADLLNPISGVFIHLIIYSSTWA